MDLAVLAAEAEATGIDKAINDLLGPVADAVSTVVFFSIPVAGVDIPLILLWLIGGSVFFTFFLRFINLRGFRHSIDVVRGEYDDPDDPGETTHFQALMTALSATVGLGNIAGVAIAISIGGPGAAFWMIIAAFFGMSMKFVECSLGVKYRDVHEDGTVSGGPMYYMEKGFENRGISRGFSKGLAVFYGAMVILAGLGAANMFQVNQAHKQFVEMVGEGFWSENAWVFGVIMAVAVGVVILGGIKSIGRVTEKLVPFMAGVYILAALTIVVFNFSDLPGAIGSMISGAFTGSGAVEGGIIGAFVAGIQRSAFSNEAGLGSAAIAHSSAKTDLWIREGFVGQLGPFFDTVIVCTATAVTIIITDVYEGTGGDVAGITLTSEAFEQRFGWFPNVLAIAVILFAFSTMLSWSYYCVKGATYLFGDTKPVERAMQVVFCIFIVLGAPLALDAIVPLMDSFIFMLPLANIIALYVLGPEIREDMKEYWAALQDGRMQKYEDRKQDVVDSLEDETVH